MAENIPVKVIHYIARVTIDKNTNIAIAASGYRSGEVRVIGNLENIQLTLAKNCLDIHYSIGGNGRIIVESGSAKIDDAWISAEELKKGELLKIEISQNTTVSFL